MLKRNARRWLPVVVGLLLGAFAGMLLSQPLQPQRSWVSPLRGDHATMSSGEGLIVFTSSRSGTWEIWVMRSDGAFPRQLTNDGAWKSLPEVSMDGRRIVYTSDPDFDGTDDVYMINIDGSNPTRLTDAAARGHDYRVAAWHPNCEDVVAEDWVTNRLYIIDADNPPFGGGPAPRPVEPSAPSGGYSDWLGSVGPGSMITIQSTDDQFHTTSNMLLDDRNHIMVYVQGDACYQAGIASTCGLRNFPVTVQLSRSQGCTREIRQSPQLLDPAFFGSCWTGETAFQGFQFGDTRYDDNSGSYTIWLIPYPTW